MTSFQKFKRKVLASFLLLALTSSLSAGAMSLQTDQARAEFVNSKVIEAKNVLSEAYKNPWASKRAKQVYTKLWNYLNNEKIYFPPVGEDYFTINNDPEFCKRAAAFAIGNKVYICGKFLDDAQKHSHLLSNMLIHEAAHATGVDQELLDDGECGADMASISAHVHANREAVALGGFYISNGRCKLTIDSLIE